MKVPLLDLKGQYQSIKDEMTPVLTEVIESQLFILGPNVEKLEAEIARYCGAPYAVGVTSGSDALLLALMAMDITAGRQSHHHALYVFCNRRLHLPRRGCAAFCGYCIPTPLISIRQKSAALLERLPDG